MQPARENVEAILPLVPVQRALLVRRGRDDEDPGFLQVRGTLRGPLDAARLQRAWAGAVARHQALRISIPPRDDPLAVVWRRVELPWTYEDWTDRRAAERAADLADWLGRDRKLGVDLGDAPAMRVTVIRTAPDAHELIWSCHHVFLDGWSAAIVLDDVLSLYRAEDDPAVRPAPAPPLQAYYRWVQGLDPAAAEAYWRTRLAGFGGNPPLGRGALGTPSDDVTHEVDGALVAAIPAAAAELQVPANTLLQAAWSLVLARMLGSDDVVFGAVVAGRSAGVAGLDRMVGNFSNAVPVRVRLDLAAPVREWLRTVRDAQFEMQQFEHASLADVHAWSDVPGHRPLFETVLAVESFALPGGSTRPDGGVTLEDFRSDLTSSFPVTVAVLPGERWRLVCRFEQGVLRREQAAAIVQSLESTLADLVRRPDDPVGGLLEAIGLAEVRPPPAAPAARAGRGHALPRDEVERRLASIWEKALGIEEIGVHDDFFDLGGTSLTGVRLFSLVEDGFGTKLPLSTLFSGTTIATQANLLRDGELTPPAWKHLVPIQAGGSRPPIACVHANTGEILFYRDLARELGPDQPVFGIEPTGLDGEEAPLEDTRTMAASYVEELRAAQPEGPYRLVGYCFGAVLSLEMARQLEAQGQQVDLVVAIDPPFARTGPRWRKAVDLLREGGAAALASAAMRKARLQSQELLGVGRDRLARSDAGRRRSTARQRLVAACRRAFRDYEPAACAAPIALIRSAEMVRWTADLPLGWDTYTADLSMWNLDTGHDTILADPAVGQVAQIINDELAKPRAGRGES